MTAARIAALGVPALLWGCALAAQTPPERPYVPDLKRWRLELIAPPGGWLSQARQTLRFRLADPGDPDPPKDGPGSTDPYLDAERYRPEAPEPEPAPAELRRRRLRAEAVRKANLWRDRTVKVWCNGEASTLNVEVNREATFWVDSQSGENRLELFEPDSGARATCSWWVSSARTRLRASVQRDLRDGLYPSGDLQVLEPDGSLADWSHTTPSGGRVSWMDYSNPGPPAGTYTVRWKPSPYQEPAVVTVLVLLDQGTDQERQWRMDRLILPGSPPTILGTFDVDH